MSTSSNSPDEKQTVIPRDAAYWAKQTSFKVTNAPIGALNLNVDGRLAVSPLQGFGQMWQKTYRVHLEDINVKQSKLLKVWKKTFPKFCPRANHFIEPLPVIVPG